MSDKVAHAVAGSPRRRFGFGTGFTILVAVVVMLASGALAATPAAHSVRRTAATSRTISSRVGPRRKDQPRPTVATTAQSATQQQNAPLPTQAQANAYATRTLSRLTVEEKFGQLTMAGPTTPISTLEQQACDGEVGSVLDLTGVANINAVQNATLAQGCHPRIPLIFSLDVIHGYKTMFPVPLGEASSWDPALVQNDESVSASEATADGLKWTFNPMVDIARDPRWGRVVEGAGEDPVPGFGDRRRQGPRLPGQQLRRARQDGGDDQALRRLRRPGRRPRIQHGRYVDRSSCSTTTCLRTRRRSTPA